MYVIIIMEIGCLGYVPEASSAGQPLDRVPLPWLGFPATQP